MSLRRRRLARNAAALLVMLAAAAGTPLAAQTVAGPAAAPAGVQSAAPRSALSTNPFLALFGYYTGEFERGVGRNTTLALSATGWDADVDLDPDGGTGGGGDDDGRVSYFTSDLHLRYYPGSTLLDGFSVGVSGGFTRLSGDISTDSESLGRRASGPTIGVEMGYNWLLGERRNVLISTGLGAKRIYVQGVNTVSAAYPTARFTLGVAF